MDADPNPPVVLVVEDDPALQTVLGDALGAMGFGVVHAADVPAARGLLHAGGVDLVLADIQLGSESGIDLCREIREDHPDVPTLVMTAFGTLDVAIQALRAGAWDFLTKPLDLDLTRIALRRALEHRDLRLEVRHLRRRLRNVGVAHGILGDSEPMKALLRMVDRVSHVDSSVLIIGESGTGKELVARAVHQLGPRKGKPFVAINCAAVPETLLESELFGHVRGAFTDARTARTGLFVQANGGTLLLDEIGDMPPSLQVKLLRVLQERRVRPVGSEHEIAVDVRVMAATHHDLEALVAEGRFREDLLYRLDVIRLVIPPLRDRGNDVLLLAQAFVQQFADRFDKAVGELTPEAARRLLDYAWPGNVRELQNCIERAIVLAEADVIRVEDLPAPVLQATRRPIGPPPADEVLVSLAAVEKRHILRVVGAVEGNRSRAADILGIDRKTLYRRLESWASADGR